MARQQDNGTQDGVCAPQDQPCAMRPHISRALRARTRSAGDTLELLDCDQVDADKREQAAAMQAELGEWRQSDPRQSTGRQDSLLLIVFLSHSLSPSSTITLSLSFSLPFCRCFCFSHLLAVSLSLFLFHPLILAHMF